MAFKYSIYHFNYHCLKIFDKNLKVKKVYNGTCLIFIMSYELKKTNKKEKF